MNVEESRHQRHKEKEIRHIGFPISKSIGFKASNEDLPLDSGFSAPSPCTHDGTTILNADGFILLFLLSPTSIAQCTLIDSKTNTIPILGTIAACRITIAGCRMKYRTTRMVSWMV